MIRVLLLREHACDFETRRAVEQLAAGLGAGFEVTVRTVGAGGDWVNALSAAWRLRGHGRDFDMVHAWGTRALAASTLSSIPGVFYTPTASPTRRAAGWVRAIGAHRKVQVICASATVERSLIQNGVEPERCRVIHPGVDFSRLRRRRDTELRTALGFAEGDQVLLACGESTPAANHRVATWAAAILNVLDRRTRLLIWGQHAGAAGVLQFARDLGQPELVVCAEQKLEREIDYEALLPAAQMALVTSSEAMPTLPIALCMGGALPIVATVTSTAAELLEDRHTALMVTPDVPRLIAQKVLALREDPGLAWRLGDTARTEAYQYFPLTRFLELHRTAYRQAGPVGEGRG